MGFLAIVERYLGGGGEDGIYKMEVPQTRGVYSALVYGRRQSALQGPKIKKMMCEVESEMSGHFIAARIVEIILGRVRLGTLRSSTSNSFSLHRNIATLVPV